MTVLLLAGTGEARRIAWGLTDTSVKVVASLAGATRHPEPLPVPTRIGGFGGEDGFRTYLAENKITAVLDATHPFAHHITNRSARVCADLGLPYALVVRPKWEAETGDNWTSIATPQDTARHIPDTATVFLATGRQTLPDYANLEGRRVLARMIDPPTEPFPFEGGEFVIGRPPFRQSSEEALFKALGVTHLVVKNAGGKGGRAKLDAARALGLPVLLLDRPKLPDTVHVTSVQEALLWVASQ
ncbi:cobalt-precorrin-6A reductase [Octadecabacter sp. G9-8]|uniref:Cobalt-precorrin-6A reductase n=1 Tax=Octadecabacter dasysiphoniae TaxID=2909341 RepID=A0ABS9D058_9RHOB|nr:cobalt-precorrin-6A reductase [Octadecabacter dasysiphoniae]MCF2872854.1 cobalt-precorrin-6A reductase [Octadecabacter dasysiphoniae]